MPIKNHRQQINQENIMEKTIIGYALLSAGKKKYLASCLMLFAGIILASALGFSEALAQDATSCINNTQNEGQCKDCCDCLDGVASLRTICRDTCATHDFSANSNFIAVTAPSTLGPTGDYSAALNTGSEAACKLYCDGSSVFDDCSVSSLT